MTKQLAIGYVFIFLSVIVGVWSVATVDISTGSSGGNGTSLWTASGSNIYYNSGNVSIGTSSIFTYLFNIIGSGGAMLIDIFNNPVASGEQTFKTGFVRVVHRPTYNNNMLYKVQGLTYFTNLGGVSAIGSNRTTVTQGTTFYTLYNTTTALGSTNFVYGVAAKGSATGGIGNKYVTGGYFVAEGSGVVPERDWALYADGNSVLGNSGDQNYIRTAPQECNTYNSNANVRSTSMSFLGEAGVGTSPYDIMCIVHIPYGYQVDAVTVYGTAGRAMTVYQSSVNSAAAVSYSVGCTVGFTCNLLSSIPFSTTNYVIVFIDFTGTGDRMQGVLTEISRYYDASIQKPTFEVEP